MVKKAILQKHIDRVQIARYAYESAESTLAMAIKKGKIKELKAEAVALMEIKEKNEDRLRKLTITDYEQRGNRQPMPGLDIREISRFEIYGNKEPTLQWCIEKRLFLKIDEVNLREFCLALPSIYVPGITTGKKTIVALASKFEVPGEEE